MNASWKLCAHFDSMAALDHAVERLRATGVDDYEVFLPILHHEQMEANMPRQGSPVRIVSAGGGVTGLVAGFGVCILSSLLYGMVTGGKAPASLVPFVVVGYELTILFAALAAVAAFVFFARLSPLAPPPHYDGRFSADRYGIYVLCKPDRVDATMRLLQAAGAVEVKECEAARA